jgi:ABC-2 type transport system ATP-binding protein
MNSPDSNVLINVNNIRLKYPGSEGFAVKDLSFGINMGEIFGLLGPNGAGKTTTINMLTGMLRADEGHIVIEGYDISRNFNRLKSVMGIVPQEVSLFSNLTVNDNLLIFGTLYGIDKSSLKDSINRFMKLYDLSHKINEKVKNLSGGMKRRLNIIIGILHSPKILILDEPTSGIDVQSKNFILSNLKEMNSNGLTILYTSHYMDEAEKFCSRIAILDMGRIIASDTPKMLVEKSEGSKDLEDVFLNLTGRRIRD